MRCAPVPSNQPLQTAHTIPANAGGSIARTSMSILMLLLATCMFEMLLYRQSGGEINVAEHFQN